jgi:hypothetical protein
MWLVAIGALVPIMWTLTALGIMLHIVMPAEVLNVLEPS